MIVSPWKKLTEELLRRNFPVHIFVLAFLAHAAPRVLQVGKCLGPPITNCGNSILAGCQTSVSMARGLLYTLVAELSKVDPEYPCHEHVDDLSHVLVAETASQLKIKLLQAGRVVGSEVKRLQLKLSTKSKIIPDNSLTITSNISFYEKSLI